MGFHRGGKEGVGRQDAVLPNSQISEGTQAAWARSPAPRHPRCRVFAEGTWKPRKRIGSSHVPAARPPPPSPQAPCLSSPSTAPAPLLGPGHPRGRPRPFPSSGVAGLGAAPGSPGRPGGSTTDGGSDAPQPPSAVSPRGVAPVHPFSLNVSKPGFRPRCVQLLAKRPSPQPVPATRAARTGAKSRLPSGAPGWGPGLGQASRSSAPTVGSRPEGVEGWRGGGGGGGGRRMGARPLCRGTAWAGEAGVWNGLPSPGAPLFTGRGRPCVRSKGLRGDLCSAECGAAEAIRRNPGSEGVESGCPRPCWLVPVPGPPAQVRPLGRALQDAPGWVPAGRAPRGLVAGALGAGGARGEGSCPPWRASPAAPGDPPNPKITGSVRSSPPPARPGAVLRHCPRRPPVRRPHAAEALGVTRAGSGSPREALAWAPGPLLSWEGADGPAPPLAPLSPCPRVTAEESEPRAGGEGAGGPGERAQRALGGKARGAPAPPTAEDRATRAAAVPLTRAAPRWRWPQGLRRRPTAEGLPPFLGEGGPAAGQASQVLRGPVPPPAAPTCGTCTCTCTCTWRPWPPTAVPHPQLGRRAPRRRSGLLPCPYLPGGRAPIRMARH
ncbi:uncharacterized protein LOC144303270 [Canis aureus]